MARLRKPLAIYIETELCYCAIFVMTCICPKSIFIVPRLERLMFSVQIFIRTLNQIVHKMWLEEISTLAYISAQVLHFCKTPQAANNIRHTDENTSLPQ